MAAVEATRRRLEFSDCGTFDEQLAAAVRKSPWWVISLGVHAALYAISTVVVPPEERPEAEKLVLVAAGAEDAWSEDDVSVVVGDAQPLSTSELAAGEPRVKDAEFVDGNLADNEEPPAHDDLGDGGDVETPLFGPASNTFALGTGLVGGAFQSRGGHRNLRAGGGGMRAEDAVEDSLGWLATHQSPDGRWECAGWGNWCRGLPATEAPPDGAGKAQYDVGVTGLALLAFLGAGYTNRSDGPNGRVVAAGLRFLREEQDGEGCFGSRASTHFLYNHAIAALAMVEAYGMTGSANYRAPAQKGLDLLAATRNPNWAWRYGVRPGDNDTSVTGWTMMALKSARLINAADARAAKPPSLVLDEDAFEGIRAWVEAMTDPASGRVGYQARGAGPARPPELVTAFPAAKSESMTAVGMLARIFLGEDPRSSRPIERGAALCATLVPRWDPSAGSIDFCYWYYGTLAMFQVGGEPWKKWEAAMKTDIVDRQRRDTDYCQYKGSWDPVDPWSPDGGRVYATACLAMCLEVWYRYDKVLGER